ncbi:hypothetical protein LCGC14_0147270 [marine sediment metagenome]|uniref:Uncharacterized protein n=1 Tax=marine sediment metagenome TaxID=412755 RepID=A0A0F9V067_9ZZZZ
MFTPQTFVADSFELVALKEHSARFCTRLAEALEELDTLTGVEVKEDFLQTVSKYRSNVELDVAVIAQRKDLKSEVLSLPAYEELGLGKTDTVRTDIGNNKLYTPIRSEMFRTIAINPQLQIKLYRQASITSPLLVRGKDLLGLIKPLEYPYEIQKKLWADKDALSKLLQEV